MRKYLKIINNLIWLLLIAFMLLIGATFLPITGNYKIYSVRSGSMEPSINLGNLIFVKPYSSYNVGDVVTLNTGKNNETVTHRIIEKKQGDDGETIVTKGDANEEADASQFKRSDIIGKVFLSLPFVGYPIAYAQTKVGFVFLIIVPSVVIIYEEIRNIAVEVRRRFRKENTDNTTEEAYYFERNKEDQIRITSIHEGVTMARDYDRFDQPIKMSPIVKRKIV